MDGTFLRPDKTYDRERFERILERMDQNGIRFVVASGNQYWQLKSFFEPEDRIAYASENGHFLFDIGAETPFYGPPTNPERGAQLIEVLEEKGYEYLASSPEGAFVPARISPEGLAWARTYYPRLQVVDDITAHSERVVRACLLVEDTYGVADELRAAFPEEFDPVIAGPVDVDLNVPGHHKGAGLSLLGELWDIDLASAVAFGDNYNDLEMLRSVGLPVAVENAVPTIRDAAQLIAPPNSADGVLEVLDELIPA